MFPTDPLKTSAALSETVLRPLAADASTSATAPTTPTVRTTPSLLRLQRRTSTPKSKERRTDLNVFFVHTLQTRN